MNATVVKYKIHELAKDFGMKSNVFIDMLKDYSDAPKKSQTSLTTDELDIVFDTITGLNQVESFDKYFAMTKPAENTPEAPAEEVPAEEAPAQEAPAEEAAE